MKLGFFYVYKRASARKKCKQAERAQKKTKTNFKSIQIGIFKLQKLAIGCSRKSELLCRLRLRNYLLSQ